MLSEPEVEGGVVLGSLGNVVAVLGGGEHFVGHGDPVRPSTHSQ